MKVSEYLQKLEEKYQKQIRDNPQSNSFVLLAEVLLKRKKVDEAIGVLLKGLRHNKNSITGRFLLGKIYYDRWMIDQAKNEFEKIIRISPDNLAVGKLLIQIYECEGNYDKAFNVAEKLSFHFPNDENVEKLVDDIKKQNEKNIHFESKRYSLSTRDENFIKNFLSGETDDTNELISETLADLYMKQGYYSESVEIYNKLLTKKPTDSSLIEKIVKAKRLNLKQKTV